jgi:hypothetical protein
MTTLFLNFTFLDIFSTGSQKNMHGTVFYDGILLWVSRWDWYCRLLVDEVHYYSLSRYLFDSCLFYGFPVVWGSVFYLHVCIFNIRYRITLIVSLYRNWYLHSTINKVYLLEYTGNQKKSVIVYMDFLLSEVLSFISMFALMMVCSISNLNFVHSAWP